VLLKRRMEKIMSFSLYQRYFDALRENVAVKMGVTDRNDNIVASVEKSIVGSKIKDIDIKYASYPLVCDNVEHYSFFIENNENYDIKTLAGVVLSSLSALKSFDREIDDVEYFYQQVISGNLDNKVWKIQNLNIEDEQFRAVFIVHVSSKHLEMARQIINECAPVREKDCIFINDYDEIVLIRSCKTEPSNNKLISIAQQISVAIMSEIFEQPSIGIGCISDKLGNLEKAYKTALNALEIGFTFENRTKIYSYMNLGISRLISSISVEKCKSFLREIFPNDILSEIDSDTLNTVQRFFDFDLNISLAARELYIHRNTLVYRLDRVQKLTGLDVRKFDDALLFKMAVLIHKHLISNRK
jgi:carbohydrate diacid regulator